jgi:adenine-specific DNA-methyltransferase
MCFNNKDVFATPKPERLIERILTLASNPDDLILDSFLGSGTTAAVAHKMGRRWMGIELGEHCDTHCVPRLQKVVDGTDQGGISKAMNWTGGGGFKYYNLAPSLLQQDEKENWLINPDYDENMLAEAMAKHQGFTYKPKLESFWKQGFSTENDYIYTTDKLISLKLLEEIHSSMRAGETLLICCKAFEAKCKDTFDNITIKKIPASVLKKCEFGKEDYSLKITETNSEEEPSLT